MHPLTPDLSKLSEDELYTKRTELQNRMTYAYRIGSADMVGQIQLMLMDFSMEIERRYQKMLNDAQKQSKEDPESPLTVTRD